MEVALLGRSFTSDKYIICPQNNTAFQNTNNLPHILSLSNMKGIYNIYFFL